MEHKHLLESDRWQKLRRFVYERDGGLCVICGNPGIDTHHWNYRSGFFNPAIVSLLCRPCHRIWQGENPDHLDDDHELKPKLIRIAEIARALGRNCHEFENICSD